MLIETVAGGEDVEGAETAVALLMAPENMGSLTCAGTSTPEASTSRHRIICFEMFLGDTSKVIPRRITWVILGTTTRK